MKKFADIVEQVKELSLQEKEDLHDILDHILADDRRKEILQNHKESLAELKSGKLKFSSNPEALLKAINKE
ncbi:MAG: hypothetical protein JWO06_447 [Bacteroidota bacterium]|nr:hypothetical protein [Bacteroidota bacterium]